MHIHTKYYYVLESHFTSFLYTDSGHTAYPMDVPVSSPLDLYIAYLKSEYTSDRLPKYDKWPVVKGKKYINLSLLDKEDLEQQEAHQYTKAMFHGKISSINPSKKMEMQDIAKTDDGSILKGRQRCILVEGAPGVGKSTFAWKLCRKWGKGKILQQYRVVLLLRLREKKVKDIKKDSDMFRRCEPIAIEEICRSGGEGVLLLLDGWDELPEELREEDSFFLDLMQGQVLPEATVLVTSRPHASEIIVTECPDRIFQHIQIAGFTEENVQAFISSSVSEDKEILKGLRTYVSYYPHIKSMMYNPLNAAIVVEVYKNSYKEDSTVPKTMTELYSSLIRSLLLRYVKENSVGKKRRNLRKFSDLPPDIYERFCKVCKIANDGINNKQQVIFSDSDLPEDFESLGLMQCVPELYVDETVLSYNFLHLTIQEFLAAFHVSLQSAGKQVELFQLYQKNRSNKMVLKFFAGLTNFSDFADDFLISLLTSEIEYDNSSVSSSEDSFDDSSNDSSEGSIEEDSDANNSKEAAAITVDGIHFLFEANQRVSVLDTLSKVCFTSFLRKIFWISPFDFYVLGYIVSHTSCSWKIQVQYMEGSAGETLAKGTLKHDNTCPVKGGQVRLEISANSSKPFDLTQFFTAHQQFLNRLSNLELTNIHLDAYSCSALSQSVDSLLLPQLETLKLSGNDIGSGSFHAMAVPCCKLLGSLQKQNTLTYLDFASTKIGLLECEALAKWLSSPTCSLKKLNISYNTISFHATEVIVSSLCQNCSLNDLDISNSRISLKVLSPLIQLPLLRLILHSCELGPEEACAISKAYCTCNSSKLKILDLTGNPVGDNGVRAFADILIQNKVLEHFNLLNVSNLTELGVEALLGSLKHNDTLIQLGFKNLKSMTTTDKRIHSDWKEPSLSKYSKVTHN